MKNNLVILFVLISGSLFAQSGNWEVYDTLSIEQTKLGNMTLNKVKLYHKKLTLNEDGTFKMEHIEPKGFYINANVEGTWKKEIDGVMLIYQDEYEDGQGKVTEKTIEEKLLIASDEELIIKYQNKEMSYLKK